MNIHEFQAKQLLAQHGVAVPAGAVAATADEARSIAEALFKDGHKRVVVKSQIHAGGRGKGVFKSACRAA
jgi:succinyl-CoA synthetase beta subunit